LLAFSFLPVIMLFSFFVLLPPKPKGHDYIAAAQEDVDPDTESLLDDTVNDAQPTSQPKLSQGPQSTDTWHNLKVNLVRAKSLFFP
jgi:battenin